MGAGRPLRERSTLFQVDLCKASNAIHGVCGAAAAADTNEHAFEMLLKLRDTALPDNGTVDLKK